ncbi:MAG: sugar phosphate isomerase/epimerase, partial [Clostridia bacterium]|nr:sugar phosphate isomerase/epimerase [Clostridia bacterium]
MKRNLGIVASCIVGENPIDTLDKIKAHGFDCFFTLVKDLSFSLKMKEKAEKLGLDYEFIHAPWGGINEIWTAENDPQIYTDYLNSIDIASAASVKTVILHLSSGENAPFVSDKGFKRFDRLVEYAKQKKVVLAIENQRKLGNLSCALERYENNPTVGFCYDNGHEHCFTENIPFLDFYAKKVICTHIHDNFGKKSGDVHFLPFDGDCDFNYMMNGLNAAGYTGSLMLETSNKGYQQMGVDE